MANSRSRSMPRASSRLATFAQPIASTSRTAPSMTLSEKPTSPIRCSRNDTTAADLPMFVRGFSRAIAVEIAVISLCAWSIVTPGASRATTFHHALPRVRFSYSSMIFGVHTPSSPGRGSSWRLKAFGRTPTTVYGSPSRLMLEFTIAGLPPKWLCQKP
jgi:hypothetical protein